MRRRGDLKARGRNPAAGTRESDGLGKVLFTERSAPRAFREGRRCGLHLMPMTDPDFGAAYRNTPGERRYSVVFKTAKCHGLFPASRGASPGWERSFPNGTSKRYGIGV